jgi:hypothetical protein
VEVKAPVRIFRDRRVLDSNGIPECRHVYIDRRWDLLLLRHNRFLSVF